MGYEREHWRLYNLQRRLFGLMALFVGGGFIVSALVELVGTEPPRSRADVWAFAVSGVLLIIVGRAVCRIRTYRPDLGDISWWAGKAGGYDPKAPQAGAPRSWWTGDPR